MSEIFAKVKLLRLLGDLGETFVFPLKDYETQVNSIHGKFLGELCDLNSQRPAKKNLQQAHQEQPSKLGIVQSKAKQPVIHVIELDTSQQELTWTFSKLIRIGPEAASEITLENKADEEP